jgi:hypothetical protein
LLKAFDHHYEGKDMLGKMDSNSNHGLKKILIQIGRAKAAGGIPKYDSVLRGRCVAWHFSTGQTVGNSAKKLGLSPLTLRSWVDMGFDEDRENPSVRVLRVVPEDGPVEGEKTDNLGSEKVNSGNEKYALEMGCFSRTVEVHVGPKTTIVMSIEQLDISFLKKLSEV